MSLKKSLYYVISITLVIISAILSVTHKNKLKKNLVANTATPQEYMVNLKVTHFNDLGFIKDTITAEYWEYMPKLERSNITKPVLSIIKPSNNIWQVSAAYGNIKQKSLEADLEKLKLWDNVVIKQQSTNKNQDIIITTNNVNYFPKNEFIETDAFVKMIKPGLIISGTGLQGYLNKNWVEILNNVETKYSLHTS